MHTRGVTKTYARSEALIMENSLLFLDVVYLRGEFNIGSTYVIREIISIVYVRKKKKENDHKLEKVIKNIRYG